MAIMVFVEQCKRITKVMIESESISKQMEPGKKGRMAMAKGKKIPPNIQNTISMAQCVLHRQHNEDKV